MSGLMAHDEHNSYSNVPNTKDGFLYNSQGTELNSLGHRCKEIKKVLGEDLQFPRYFLVLGDNACLHMHKPVEETWPYLLSKAINHQYYNFLIYSLKMDVHLCMEYTKMTKYLEYKSYYH